MRNEYFSCPVQALCAFQGQSSVGSYTKVMVYGTSPGLLQLQDSTPQSGRRLVVKGAEDACAQECPPWFLRS